MRAESKFNKIYVIESLGPKDLHAASRLYNDIIKWETQKLKGLYCEFFHIQNSSELHSLFIEIAEETKRNRKYPILHMDFHGSKKGFSLGSGKIMEWEELFFHFREINIACRNNLLITLAACYGVYLTKIVKPTEPVPFWGLIAPNKDIRQGDIDVDFKNFYEELLTSLNGDKALEKLILAKHTAAQRYSFHNCINLYRIAYSNYHRRFCTGKNVKKRIEDLITRARSTPSLIRMPIGDVRKKVKYEIRKNEREHFDKCRKVFFMIDIYPENDARFKLMFEDVINEG